MAYRDAQRALAPSSIFSTSASCSARVKPAAADPEGGFYTFERGVSKTGGGNGWADVWMRDHFGCEYKG